MVWFDDMNDNTVRLPTTTKKKNIQDTQISIKTKSFLW